MAKRERKAGPRQLENYELQEVDRLLRAAGGWMQLRQQHEEWRKNPRRGRGRPQNDFFTDFSVDPGPAEGLFIVRFKAADAGPLCLLRHNRQNASLLCIVSPKKPWMKELKHSLAPEGKIKLEYVTPHQAFGAIVKILQEAFPAAERWRLGAGTIDNITHRLTNQLREAIRAQKRV